ncbi:MAG TPA: hypothetical protein VFE46_11135 [Pirellulales bacterium]|jgi:hypothetical protein|nr:hypothetical protein [Pirellulales bacterium]
MRIENLKVGDTVGLQYESGKRISAAQIMYVGSTCYQLSNGLLYRRIGGRCVQGALGGTLVLGMNAEGDDLALPSQN